jgi:hypothetical protein
MPRCYKGRAKVHRLVFKNNHGIVCTCLACVVDRRQRAALARRR